jgi:DNA polymerase-3 subunit epsilon
MTRKQSSFNLSSGDGNVADANAIRRVSSDRNKLKVILASADEENAHAERLSIVSIKGGEPLWK